MKQTLWQPLPITYRGFVYPSQLNPHGRLHERVQVDCFDQASWHLLALLGVGPRRLHETSRGFITLEHRVASMQPAGTAAALSIDSELLELGISTLRYRHTMRDAETQQTLSTMERLRVFVVLRERRPIALPPIVARRAQLLFPAVAVHSGTRAEAQPAASLID